jgi:hypothetical protein
MASRDLKPTSLSKQGQNFWIFFRCGPVPEPDFIPLTLKHHILAAPHTTYEDPCVQELCKVIRFPELRQAAEVLGGYDLKDCTEVLEKSSRGSGCRAISRVFERYP